MEPVHTDSFSSDSWKEHELKLLQILVELEIPMDLICNKLGRSWTSSALRATDLGLNWFAHLKRVKSASVRNSGPRPIPRKFSTGSQ